MINNKQKAIKILEKNRLYEDEIHTDISINANKEEEFFKKYKFKDSNINSFPKNINRDENGYIMLQEIPYLVSNLSSDGNFEARWLLLSNGSRIFVKKCDYYNQLLELMFKGLCDQLNIDCANYDLVRTDKVYLASQSFLKVDEYLYDYYGFEGGLKNIKELGIKRLEIDDLIKKSNRIHDTNRMLKTIFIDTLTNHFDRFPHNYKIINTRLGHKASPLYDNGGCCESIEKYLFYRVSHKFSIEKEDILYKLLLNKNFYSWFIKNFNNINIEKIAENIYKKKRIYIDSVVYEDFDKTVSDGLYVSKQLSFFR